MDDGRGWSERWGALCTVLNVPSDCDIVNVARLELVTWEQGTGTGQSFCLSILQALLVRENAKFMFWNVYRDFSGISILDLHVTFLRKRKKKQNTKLSTPKTLPKLTLWCIALGKPARLFNTFIASSWELNLLFTDPSPVTGHDHISAYIIPSRFSSTHWFKNQSIPRPIISVLLLGYMSQVLISQWRSNDDYSSTCFWNMRKERLASCFFSRSTLSNWWYGWINTYISPTVQKFAVVHLFMFCKFSHVFTIPLGRSFFKTSIHQGWFELPSFYTALSLISSYYLYSYVIL